MGVDPNSVFHLSKRYLGGEPILKPKVPWSAMESIEGNIPHICVSDAIHLCMRSITSSNHVCPNEVLKEFRTHIGPFQPYNKWIQDDGSLYLNPSIYYTDKEPYLPPKASDFRSNKERWFITDTQFKFLGYLDLYSYLFESNNCICLKLTDNKYLPVNELLNRLNISKEEISNMFDNKNKNSILNTTVPNYNSK